MTTLRAALHDYVREQVDVAVYDSRLSTNPLMPAIVLRFISGRTIQTHSNRRSLVPRRVQFDIYSNDDAKVDEKATALLRALDGFHGLMGGVAIGWAAMLMDRDNPPTEVKKGSGTMEVRYNRTLDFEVAYQEVVADP